MKHDEIRRLQEAPSVLGDFLADYLNGEPEHQYREIEPPQGTFGKTIEAMKSMEDAVGSLRGRQPDDQWRERFRGVAEEAARPFVGVVLAPVLIPPTRGWILRWGYNGRGDEVEPDEYAGEALRAIADLGEAGLLHRMRRCGDCGRWLYAKFERQRFCSDACREKSFRGSRKTPQGKRKRRDYMRRYRAGLKQMDRNYLRASTQTRR